MFTQLEAILISLSEEVSLPFFVFAASFIEEIIAPIPSPTIMLVSGSLAHVQGYVPLSLVLLIVIGSLGKTFGALCVYYISAYARDFVLTTCGRFLSITEDDIARFRARLSGTTKDYVLLTLLRAFPFIPSVVLSAGSGILRLPIPLFIFSTFIGTLVRDGIYLCAGYYGTELFTTIIAHSEKIEGMVEGGIVLILLLLGTYVIWKRYRANGRKIKGRE
jgi:membrane protein DedA with SNARE-associated domain